MYRTFNMGAGMVLFLTPEALASARELLVDFKTFPLYEIGRVIRGEKKVTLL